MLGSQGFLGGSVIKNLLTNAEMPESWVQSLGQEDLEEAMATHSRVLVQIILMTEEVGRLQSMGSQRPHAFKNANIYSPVGLQV